MNDYAILLIPVTLAMFTLLINVSGKRSLSGKSSDRLALVAILYAVAFLLAFVLVIRCALFGPL